MSNDTTKDLTDSEKLNLILARLDTVEAILNDRLQDTRPFLQNLHAFVDQMNQDMKDRFDRIEKELRSMNRKFEVFNEEMLDMKTDLKDFNARLSDVERKPA